MGRKNWNYSSTRNRISNQVYNGFTVTGDKKYNNAVINKYFVDGKRITTKEKSLYRSLREQEFNFTDKQFDLIYSIYKKYNK